MSSSEQSCILVVDDEAALRTLMQEYLRRLGYEVEVAATAAEAWQRVEADPSAYWLVIADIVLPDASGRELLLGLLERSPRLRILVCSGVPFDTKILPEPFRAQVSYLQKPFMPPSLAEAVARLERGLAQAAGES